jgi:hypothetical protein
MIWLSNPIYPMTWVGHKEVARGDIFGDWKRFTYYVNGLRQYIYCRNQKVFLTLFAAWCSWASSINSRKKPVDLPITDEQWDKIKYNYTLEDVEGVSISTPDVIMDNPDSKPFRVKSWIHTQHGEYIQ